MRGGGLSSPSIGCVLLVLESGFKGLSRVSPCFSQGRISPSGPRGARSLGFMGNSAGPRRASPCATCKSCHADPHSHANSPLDPLGACVQLSCKPAQKQAIPPHPATSAETELPPEPQARASAHRQRPRIRPRGAQSHPAPLILLTSPCLPHPCLVSAQEQPCLRPPDGAMIGSPCSEPPRPRVLRVRRPAQTSNSSSGAKIACELSSALSAFLRGRVLCLHGEQEKPTSRLHASRSGEHSSRHFGTTRYRPPHLAPRLTSHSYHVVHPARLWAYIAQLGILHLDPASPRVSRTRQRTRTRGHHPAP